MKEKLAELRKKLSEIEILNEALVTEGAVLTYSIGSEKKSVEVVTEKYLSITVKATINQEL